MKLRLGINAGFAINRFPEPEVWLRIVGEDLGLRCCQFVADLLNPFLPEPIVREQTARLREAAAQHDVRLETIFTSQFTRVNHLLHPDRATRQAWSDWFRRLLDLGAELGALGAGAHFGILSVADNADPQRKRERIREGAQYWTRLAEHAAPLGYQYLFFEPMSIPRELACTLDETQELLDLFPADIPIPMRLCLDVDHGDLASPDPRDTDPYAWLERFGSVSPAVHLKQSHRDKGGHWPFTAEHNAQGKVTGEQVLEALGRSGCEECTLLLEVSHREREPAESRVLDDLRESVAYWRRFVAD